MFHSIATGATNGASEGCADLGNSGLGNPNKFGMPWWTQESVVPISDGSCVFWYTCATFLAVYIRLFAPSTASWAGNPRLATGRSHVCCYLIAISWRCSCDHHVTLSSDHPHGCTTALRGRRRVSHVLDHYRPCCSNLCKLKPVFGKPR